MIGHLPGPLTELLIVGLGNAPYPATRHRQDRTVYQSHNNANPYFIP
jgi:hypothetical protein